MAKRDRKVPKDDRAETDPTIEKKKKFGAKNPKDEDEREDDSDEEESDKEDADERDDDDAEPAKKSDKKVRPDKVDPKGGFRDSDKEEHGGDLSTDKKKSIKGKQIEINPELSAVVERIENIPEGLWEAAVVDEAERLADTIRSSLKRKSDDHGVPYETILEVFRRGWEARRTATLSEQENAFNRVNSFLAGGLAARLDSDLLTEEGGAGEVGTDELVSTYASDTPGQRFIRNVREKKAVKEELLHEGGNRDNKFKKNLFTIRRGVNSGHFSRNVIYAKHDGDEEGARREIVVKSKQAGRRLMKEETRDEEKK